MLGKFILCFLFAGYLLSDDLHSKHITDTLRVDLEPVMVSVNRATAMDTDTPFSITRLFRSEENRLTTPLTSTQQLLSRIPGVFVSNRDNYSLGERLSIRGSGWRSAFGVRGVHVLIDGIPLTAPDGQTILEVLDPNLIRDVEVIRGPSALFWGNGSGGALYMSTSSSEDDPILSFRTFGGSYDTYQTDVVFRTHINGRSFVSLSGSSFQTRGYRDHSEARIQRGALQYSRSFDNSWLLKYNIYAANAPSIQNPGALTASESSNSPELANPMFIRQKAGKSYTHVMNGLSITKSATDSRFESVIYGTYRDLSNPIQNSIIEINRLSGGTRNSYQRTFGDLRLSISGDAAIQFDKRKNWGNLQGTKGSLFVDQHEMVFALGSATLIQYSFQKMAISAGIRFDHVYFNADDLIQDQVDNSGSRNMSSITPQLGINYKFDGGTWFAGFTSSFETPTTTELVNRPDLQRGFNQELNPEKSYGFETGIRGYYRTLNLRYDLALYRINVRDRMVGFQTPEGGDRNFFENSGESQHQGVELSILTLPFQFLSLGLTYTYNDFTLTSNENGMAGNRIPGIPRHNLYTYAELTSNKMKMFIDVHIQDRMYTNNANTNYSKGYWISNVSISRDVGTSRIQMTPFATVRNIFDKRYISSVNINGFGGRFYEPAMPRNFQIGVAITF